MAGWYYTGGGGGSEAKKKFVYLKSTSKFRLHSMNFVFFPEEKSSDVGGWVGQPKSQGGQFNTPPPRITQQRPGPVPLRRCCVRMAPQFVGLAVGTAVLWERDVSLFFPTEDGPGLGRRIAVHQRRLAPQKCSEEGDFFGRLLL